MPSTHQRRHTHVRPPEHGHGHQTHRPHPRHQPRIRQKTPPALTRQIRHPSRRRLAPIPLPLLITRQQQTNKQTNNTPPKTSKNINKIPSKQKSGKKFAQLKKSPYLCTAFEKEPSEPSRLKPGTKPKEIR